MNTLTPVHVPSIGPAAMSGEMHSPAVCGGVRTRSSPHIKPLTALVAKKTMAKMN